GNTNVPLMELDEETLRIDRRLSALDEAVLSFVDVLESCEVEYVIVSGYVAILTGRSRATEDVDVILEELTQAETDALVETLTERDYWGMAMPLEDMYSMLSRGDRIRIAEAEEFYPNFEVFFPSTEIERTALADSLTVAFDSGTIEISPIELQIAYKLQLAQRADSPDGKDMEDALHLYVTFEEAFNTETLESYVTRLGVEDYYGRLRRI
ncbi:MAG: hypothetical protein ABEJ71_00540, partial [Halodesulfurarchaeum sp.]